MESIIKLLVDFGMPEDKAKSAAKAVADAVKAEAEPAHEAVLKEAKAATSRILEEKKTAGEKLAVVESELAELKTSGLSDTEKLTAALEKAQSDLATAKAEADNRAHELKTQRRERGIDALVAGFKFKTDLPDGMGRRELAGYIADIDLDDNAAIDAATKSFTDTHNALLIADVPGGSGSHGDAGDGAKNNGDGKRAVADQSAEERQKFLAGSA